MSTFNDYYADPKYLPDYILRGVGSALCLICRMQVLLPWKHVKEQHQMAGVKGRES